MEQPPHPMRARRRRGRLLPRRRSPHRRRPRASEVTGAVIAFWILAPIMVLAALGILFVRKAVHAALLLAVVMISLAVLYVAQDAPFLFAVQIIVYTGAILMLFLFVLMLVGVDASDSLVETIRGPAGAGRPRRPGLGVLLVVGIGQIAPRRPRSASTRPTPTATSRRSPNLLFSQVRLRLRGHQRAADHRGRRRDGARPPRAARPRSRPSRPGRAADARTTPSRRKHLGPLPRPASTPGTTRSTPRPCCPTAPPRRVVGLPGARRPRHGPVRAGGRRRRRRRAPARRRSTPAATAPSASTTERRPATGGDASR